MSKIDLCDVQAGDWVRVEDSYWHQVFATDIKDGCITVAVDKYHRYLVDIEHEHITAHRKEPPEKPLWPCRECGAKDFEDAGNKCSTSFLCAVDKGRETGEITEVFNDPPEDDDQQEFLSEDDWGEIQRRYHNANRNLLDGLSPHVPSLREIINDYIGPRSDWMLKSNHEAEIKRLRENPRDEYHTMKELYEYRMLYNAHAAQAWVAAGYPVVKSWRHADGEKCFGGGWFIVSAQLPLGQVSNHYKAEYWDLFDVPEVQLPPEWDGHTPEVAAKRLYSVPSVPSLADHAAEIERLRREVADGVKAAIQELADLYQKRIGDGRDRIEAHYGEVQGIFEQHLRGITREEATDETT